MTTIIVAFSLHEKDPRTFRLVMKPDTIQRIEVCDTDAMGDTRWSEMTGMKQHVPTVVAAALMKVFEVLPPYAELAGGQARMLYPPNVWNDGGRIRVMLGTIKL